MAKYTCLDCKHYCPEKKVFNGIKPMGFGVCIPKEKTIEHHCILHQDVFIKWWKENRMKRAVDITEVPDCLELNDHLSQLNKMNQLMEEILDIINKP